MLQNSAASSDKKRAPEYSPEVIAARAMPEHLAKLMRGRATKKHRSESPATDDEPANYAEATAKLKEAAEEFSRETHGHIKSAITRLELVVFWQCSREIEKQRPFNMERKDSAPTWECAPNNKELTKLVTIEWPERVFEFTSPAQVSISASQGSRAILTNTRIEQGQRPDRPACCIDPFCPPLEK